MLFFTYLFTYLFLEYSLCILRSVVVRFFVVCAFALTHDAKLSQIIQIKGVKPK